MEQSKQDSSQENPQHLCTSCGLCCDGTLFLRVPLAAEDQLAKDTLAGLGAGFLAKNGIELFNLACPALDQRKCTIYSSRPKKCRTFRCDLLKDYEEGRITFDEALALIHTALKLIAQRNAQASQAGIEVSGATANGFVAKVNTLLDAAEAGEKPSLGLLAVTSLAVDLHLTKHFLK